MRNTMPNTLNEETENTFNVSKNLNFSFEETESENEEEDKNIEYEYSVQSNTFKGNKPTFVNAVGAIKYFMQEIKGKEKLSMNMSYQLRMKKKLIVAWRLMFKYLMGNARAWQELIFGDLVSLAKGKRINVQL